MQKLTVNGIVMDSVIEAGLAYVNADREADGLEAKFAFSLYETIGLPIKADGTVAKIHASGTWSETGTMMKAFRKAGVPLKGETLRRLWRAAEFFETEANLVDGILFAIHRDAIKAVGANSNVTEAVALIEAYINAKVVDGGCGRSKSRASQDGFLAYVESLKPAKAVTETEADDAETEAETETEAPIKADGRLSVVRQGLEFIIKDSGTWDAETLAEIAGLIQKASKALGQAMAEAEADALGAEAEADNLR